MVNINEDKTNFDMCKEILNSNLDDEIKIKIIQLLKENKPIPYEIAYKTSYTTTDQNILNEGV